MHHILHIDSSSRPLAPPTSSTEGSYSRALGEHIVDVLSSSVGPVAVTHRDLASDPIRHISNETIAGYYTAPGDMTDALRSATALSDHLIGEIQQADSLVITMPIYNFSVPSAFKAWIDQVVRINCTFAYEDGNFSGLVHGKKAYLAFAYGAGGYLNNGPLAGYDRMAPYAEMILNFIGITDITSFAIEATTADPATVAEQKRIAFERVDRHFVSLAGEAQPA